MSNGSNGEYDEFDCIQPTLIQQIKRILDQYPDDGQILKELIQNAEDAKAKEVKFLYDHHSYGKERLHAPDLAKFQGPALYAYNDATFSTDDWRGVRMLSDSIKEKDPTKVGRFGLGFKSVFHMTDLPSVISGDGVAIIDPEEKYFSDSDAKRSGRKWHLEKHRKSMQTIPDHFVPYKGIFGCDDDTFERGSYEGTLFRLPLRQEPSKLSDTIYSHDKMNGLLECFGKDAHLILLFLMNLERIEVYERMEDSLQPSKLFSVGISASCLDEVRKAREEFKTKVLENALALSSGSFPEVKTIYHLTIETVHYNGVVEIKSEHSYVITNLFSGSEVISMTMKKLIQDTSLSYMPWIGVALPVSTKNEDTDDAREPKGHLFCFLPLPMENKSLTGLPVHVNGFFALSQNRRHLKWPSAGQDGTTDKSLLWNKGLLQEVLPKAYAELILHVISCLQEDEPRQMMTTSDVYSAWPDIKKVDVKWKSILQPLFDTLLQSQILHTDAKGGGWCRAEEAMLDDLKKSDEYRKMVIDLLIKTGTNVVTAPGHVKTALQEYCTCDLKYVTPEVLRSRLKANPSCYVHLNHQDKILLLKFILSDSDFKSLQGLELLPLADKSFTAFRKGGNDPVYIDNPEHPKSLLPGLQRMFMDADFDGYVTEQLKKAVEEGHTQLRHFNEEAVKRHLRGTLPADWIGLDNHVTWYPGSSTQPPEKWLKTLWEYFALHFAHTTSDLDSFVGLPLVPVTLLSNQSEVQLARIKRPSSLVLASFNGETIDDSICHILKNLGLTILEHLPEYIRHYPELVPSYANPASARGVLNAMDVIFQYPQKKTDFLRRMRDLPADKIRSFRTFLSSLSSLTQNEVCSLQQLPLFETYVGHGERQPRFVSIDELKVKFGAPVDVLPDVPVYTDLLDLRDCSSRTLAQTLNTLPMTLPEFLKILLDDALREQYSEGQVDVLVKYTLELFGSFHGNDAESIKQKLQCLSFVVCSNNSRKKPTELFNPEDDLLKKIFLGQDVFPKESYYSQPEVNAHLKKLGLKGKERITFSDVINSAKTINNLEDVNKALAKSSGLLELLEKNPALLQATGNGLRSTIWIPVLRTKPNTYSKYLSLKGCDHGPFACPSDLTSQEYINVIGSVKLVTMASSAPNVSQFFGWHQKPIAEDVLNHLQNVVLSYNVEDKSNFIGAVKEIYRYLGNIHQTEVTQVMGERKWVWNGEGFSGLAEVVLENPGMNLAPYVCVLPTETREFSNLFTRCGMKASCDTDLLLDVLVRIREKHESTPAKISPLEVKRDLQLAIDVLNELKPTNGEPFDKDVRKRLLVPVHGEDDARLEMKLVEECTYYDHEWLKQGYDVSDIDDQDDVKIRFIHQNISDTTAKLLEVPTLMSRILGAEELEMGESFGQSESLLDRLRGLLEGYTDGLSVPKELIQNADDAGATEVRFLYDERTNEDCMTRLIDEGMKECQGPSLWAYNDSVFSDEDFQNIVKLNAASKKEDSRKIGRFGLGFNSVYNLTDVPSFVSRDSIVILDPHTTYLGKGIRDKSKPGIKIRMEEKRLRKLENQFKPYNGIFGCDLRAEAQQKSYNGTLFRFPLRTASQAKKSEIKPLHYDEKQVKELLEILFHGAESLLLFTQNVLRVTVYHLRNENTESPQPVELFRISKSCSKVVNQLQSEVSLSNSVQQLAREDQEFVKQSSILKVSSSFMEKQVNQGNFSSPSKVLMKSSMILNCQCTLTDHGKEYFADISASGESQVSWLVTSCIVSGKALEMASRNKGLLPTAGVATRLTEADSGMYVPVPITKPLGHGVGYQESSSCHNGSVFCFLPLPIHSGLPVHINGCFAVSDNRRYLRERTEEDKTDQGAEWNDVLMKEVVCQTYTSMLEDIRDELSPSAAYQFYSLWPRCSDLQPNCHGLACQFYSFLSSNEPKLFSDGRSWSNIQNVVFLEPAFRNEEPIGQIALDVFKSHAEGTNTIVIDLPEDIFRSFERYELKQRIEKRCYNKERFFAEVFFPAIQSIDADSRNQLVLYALDDTSGKLRELVRNYRCIPSSPFGDQLKYPKELLHPRGKAAQLFKPEDERFPHGEEFTSDESLATLKRLGMRNDDLEWEEVIERAESVQSLVPYQEGLERTKLILAFIDRKLDNDHQVSKDVQTRLQEVQFLPIKKRPEDFPFKWKGDEYQANSFLSAEELYPKSVKYLASASVPILDETKDGCGPLLTNGKRFLALAKTASLDQAKIQMENVIATVQVVVLEDNSVLFEEAKKALELLYAYFQRSLETNKDDVTTFLKALTFILGEKQLFSPSRVAFHSLVDFPPHLNSVLHSYELKFGELFKTAGVRDYFEISDYIRTLKEVKEKLGVHPVTEDMIKVTNVLQLLADTMETEKVTAEEVVKKHGTIFMPDSRGIMRPSTEVCVKDCHWMPDEKGVIYTNEAIPIKVCLTLGANTRRQETLRKHTFGLPFGQKEKLTNRLKRILTGYPCGKSIMKELLQNADDAKATKVCFINDPRQHPDEKVFEESWKPLQGPALCVYNNAPFTENDIQGIQNLGEGSKGDDPNKTGQYGVGFNAVYHLTDAPTFISQGEEIGEVMCVFDPSLKYAPGANTSNPGVMYDNISDLKEIFTDVFPCYLGEHFPVSNGTMFRFPLRNQEMADNSEICKTPITTEDLDKLLDSFKNEMLDVLLFVNNVEEISLCEIGQETGDTIEKYSVKALLSAEDEEKRRRFADHVNEVGKRLQRKEISISDVSLHQVSYVVNLEDSNNLNQKWFVVQRIGFEDPKEIPDAVIKAFNKGDLGLLPRGGVASLISPSEEPPGKAFCFLPLPFETGLPVHINGHFALDHEARRNLWRDDKGDYRSDWNDALLREVVAPCYVALLDEIRQLIALPVNANRTNLTCSRDVAEQMLNSSYASRFPSLPNREVYWETLAKEVYRYMDEKRVRLLPVLREDNTDRQDKVFIEWLPPTGEGQEKAFFGSLIEKLPEDYDQLDDKKKESARKGCRRLRDTLLAVGVNLLCMPMRVYESFKESSVEVSLISPADAIRFFGTYNDTGNQLCDVGCLPTGIKDTPFRSVENLLVVLKYCREGEEFMQHLDGLPLLLTQDGVLRVLSSEDPVFLSGYSEIVPHSSPLFVHNEMFVKIFYPKDGQVTSPVFKDFDISAFANLLPREMNEEVYKSSDGPVAWNPEEKTKIPNKNWIWHVWRFFSNFVKKLIDDRVKEKTKEMKDEPRSVGVRLTKMEQKSIVRDALSPVNQWCLLPATEKEKEGYLLKSEVHLLFSLSLAESVIDFHSFGYEVASLKMALEKMELPELNCQILDTGSYTLFYSKTARQLVACLEDPTSISTVLIRKLKRNPKPLCGLNPHACNSVLRFFNDQIGLFNKEQHSEDLKALPFYTTIHDESISINGMQAIVLSDSIPKNDMHIWQEKSKIAFLKEDVRLKELYSFLECDSMNAIDLYCDIIFEKFHEMSEEARLEHLKFLSTLLMDDLDALLIYPKRVKREDKEKLLQGLRNLKFIPDKQGSLKTASCFYDPSIEVFQVMFENQEMFPPKPFCEWEWLSFLRRIGLIHEVSNDQFLQFAKEVETEAKTRPSNVTKKKSQTLVKHLFKIENVATDRILNDVKEICFIFPVSVDSSLQSLHKQHGMKQGGLPYICFQDSVADDDDYICWTSANILPYDANPMYAHDVKPNYKGRNYLNFPPNYKKRIFQQLGILEKPTVDMVVTHCKTICKVFVQRKPAEDKKSQQSRLVLAIMTSIYKYLQSHYYGINEEIINELKDVRCIVVDDGKRFVFPNQVAVDITSEQEIPPYLYKIPLEIGAYAKLFQNLGTTNTVTTAQYSMVLKTIHDESVGEKLHPNEVRDAFKVTKGLFEMIMKLKEVDAKDITPLYLPGEKRNPDDEHQLVVLQRSTNLVFNDAPNFRERIKCFERLLLVKLEKCGLEVPNDDLLIKKLPESLRPRMLTSVVRETLVKECTPLSCSSTAQELRIILTSGQFCHGLIRMIRHSNYESEVKISHDTLSNVRQKLSCIYVFGVLHLRTRLVCSGQAIPKSEADVSCFGEKEETGECETWKIYVEEGADLKRYFSRVAIIVDRMTGSLLGKEMLTHLSFMLSLTPSEIKSFLDELGVREDNSYLDRETSYLPPAGSYINIDDHHLLVDAFVVFRPGDYVGYELDDPSIRGEDGTPTYIYAVVIEEVIEDGQHSNLDPSLRKYRIDIGKDKEHIVVDAAVLYMFQRPDKSSDECLEVRIYCGPTSDKSKQTENLGEVLKRITRILEEAWKLPEEKRRNIIKRLFLTWHPDKNPGNEEFCTKVFQFIQGKIEKLEKGDSASPWRASGYSYGGYYGSYFRRWSGRARYRGRQSSAFHSGGGFSTFFWGSYRPNPQPGEVRRWYRQAKADLEAASNDVQYQRTSYEWACFKCHQSAEKTLKAAQFSKDANKTSTHSLTALAQELNSSTLQNLASELECLVGNSMRMRYPDQVTPPNIPHDVYDKETASRAMEIASEILQDVKSNYVN